jgi:hypothetical protein
MSFTPGLDGDVERRLVCLKNWDLFNVNGVGLLSATSKEIPDPR